ncbi:MAG: DUF3237 domain-containing protein [Cetobacterium sp.]|uniref:DUF3237 domain-containing protein n=1 Tax=Cetobacterium sp. TaxID=2071632 RepID=UPI003F3FE654
MEKIFSLEVKVGQPIVVGSCPKVGRRQLIPILDGEVVGKKINGIVLPGGIDSQIIKNNGVCELSARYAIKLNDGETIYIENNGIRTVPKEFAIEVFNGKFIDPSLYYFRTVPKFEVYSDRYSWLTETLIVCEGKRYHDKVVIDFFKL